MAEIGVLEGYKHKEDVPDSEYLRLENQLSFPLYVVAKEIVNAYRSHLDPLNLTYTQYIVMMALWQYGDLSVKELGQVLRLDSGTLTPLLKKLEAKAFLKRKRSRQDTGKALRDVAVHIPRRLAESSGPIFDVEETRQLRMLLNKLLEAIDNANAKTAENMKG